MDRNTEQRADLVQQMGQARKSLWIETIKTGLDFQRPDGQARKSLWIETIAFLSAAVSVASVRLVRACGSKLKHKERYQKVFWSGS